MGVDEAKHYLVSLTAMSLAGIATAPFDTIKTRLQMQVTVPGRPLLRGGDMAVHIVRTESWRALFKGVVPMLGRAFTHGALRMSLYDPAKTALASQVSSRPSAALTAAIKVTAAAASGAFAAIVSNPLELLKVRVQTDTASTSMWTMLRRTVQAEGVMGLWKGT